MKIEHPLQVPERELNWRLLLLGAFICAIAAAATPYVVLKLGMSVDLSFGGMFLAAALLGRYARDSKKLAIELNIIQTMINAVSGVGFMCVILAAFYYIQVVFHRNIGFSPAWWQISLWLLVSANLGVFMGALPRRMILNDASLPWPGGRAVLGVIDPLTDPAATEMTARRRTVLTVSTAVAGFLTFLKDGLGVITPMMGNESLKMMFGLELAAIGTGMFIPLAVGLSGLLGVWVMNTFGDKVSSLTALSGTTPANWDQCVATLGKLDTLKDAAKTNAMTFLTNSCGKAAEWVAAPSHFKMMVQWFMWPATAMMITAALTSVLIPLVYNFFSKDRKETVAVSLADEEIPTWWIWTGIGVCVAILVWLQGAWFAMPWQQVLVAVALQPILIISGLRVLGITGQGPVSLMANATQFLFGLIWPAHIKQNLNAAHISADPQASSENTVASFWVARRLGGRFRTLITSQLIMLPIGALILPVSFNLLVKTYGIGLEKGQLAAPTGLKIASLAIVMEKGLSALPHGALTASLIAGLIGILFELMLMVRKRDSRGEIMKDENGNTGARFWWIPIPSALGFALILPPPLTLGLAFGSVVAATWRKFSPSENGSYGLFCAPLAAGFVAGEAMVGAILLPVLGALVALVMAHL